MVQKNENVLLANIKIWSCDPLYKRSLCGSKNLINLSTLEWRLQTRQNEYEESNTLRNKLILENFSLLSNHEAEQFNVTEYNVEQVSVFCVIFLTYHNNIVHIISVFIFFKY